MIQQPFTGTEYDAQRGSTRIAMLSILFAMMVLFAVYSAAMTSLLAVVIVQVPFEGLVGMYRDTDYKLGSVKNTAFDNFFDVRI